MNVNVLRYIANSVRDRLLVEKAGDSTISSSTLKPIIEFYTRVFEYNDADSPKPSPTILQSRKEIFIEYTLPLILQGKTVSKNIVGATKNTVEISASESSKFTEELLTYIESSEDEDLREVYERALESDAGVLPLYDQLIALFELPDYKREIADQVKIKASAISQARLKKKEEEKEKLRKKAEEEEDLYDEEGEYKKPKKSKKEEDTPSETVSIKDYEDIYGPLEPEESEPETDEIESSESSGGKVGRGRRVGTTYKDTGRETGWDIYKDVKKKAKDRLIYDIKNKIIEIDEEDPLEYPSKNIGFFPRINFEKSKDNFYKYIKVDQASREGNVRNHWPSTLEALYLLFAGKNDKQGLDLLSKVYIHTETAAEKKDKSSQIALSSITRGELDPVFEHFVSRSGFKDIFLDPVKLRDYFGDKALKLKWPGVTNYQWMRGQRGKSNWNGCFYKDGTSLCPEDIGHLEGGVLKKSLRTVEKHLATNVAPLEKVESRKARIDSLGQQLFSRSSASPGHFTSSKYMFRTLEFLKEENPFFRSISPSVKTEYVNLLDDIQKLLRQVETSFESFQKIYSHEIIIRKSGSKSPVVNIDIDDDEDFTPLYVPGEEFAVSTTGAQNLKKDSEDNDDGFDELG